MARVFSREQAQELVRTIFRDHGFVDEEYWQAIGSWNEDVKNVLREAMMKKDEMLGHMVITLAKNLYSSNVRFLFELLQNCEDNHYDEAFRRGEDPYVLFQVHQDRIVTECNEDGFTEENLRSICAVGQSSKSATQTYIGEKGIGFKSVFKVADKVVIQSGYFSFSFEHKRGDSGMGMISPQWENHANLPVLAAGKTRMTLWLRQDDYAEDVLYSVREQFESLHEEMLLFMRKLKKITVEFYNGYGGLDLTTTYSSGQIERYLHKTERQVWDSAGVATWSQNLFHVNRFPVTGLPRSETRDYSDQALAQQSYSNSEIILAFPLTADEVPLLENQLVFSFLPTAETGFKFIIQADFVMSANRETIEISSWRNKALRDRIPWAFMASVTEMCEHNTLQYQWMRYLPSREDHAWNPFWTTLIDKIQTQLQCTPVLRGADYNALRKIGEMRSLSYDAVDQNGLPLFPDIEPLMYLSPYYASSDLRKLERHGLSVMSMELILDRALADLSSPTSRMKSFTDQDWHRRAALILQLPFEKNWTCTATVKDMKLIPLSDGRWVSCTDGASYFQDLSNRLTIPEGLSLNVIDPAAAHHPQRRQLFEYLGATRASVQLVRTYIHRRYERPFRCTIYRNQSVQDLRFLYLTEGSSTSVGQSLDVGIFIEHSRNNNWMRYPAEEDLYLRSDTALSPYKLLGQGISSSEQSGDGEIPRVTFIHNDYLSNAPADLSPPKPSWVNWLHDTIQIRRDLRLKDKTSDSLSAECQWIAENRPENFMALLNRLWRSQGQELRENRNFKSDLLEIQVLCQRGFYIELEDSLIPTTHNVEVASRFLADGDPFRWLDLGSSDETVEQQKWGELTKDLAFGFPENDLDLALKVFEHIRYTSGAYGEHRGDEYSLDGTTIGSHGHKRVFDLYVFLDAQVRAARNKQECIEKVRRAFTYEEPIFIPPTEQDQFAIWAKPKRCLWSAPVPQVNSKYVLKHLYSCRPGLGSSSSTTETGLSDFFKNTLRVSKWTWKIAVEEIELQKEGEDFDRILDLYKCLLSPTPSRQDAEEIRHVFAQKELIYVPGCVDGSKWHNSSDCLWTLATNIPGKTPINNSGDYDELEKFFLDIVGVRKMTAKMLIDKLTSPDLNVTLPELKFDLLELSALLPNTQFEERLKRNSIDALRGSSILPVRKQCDGSPDGEVVRLQAESHFAIVDHGPMALAFKNRAALLDFTLEEVRSLSHFIRWIGLEDRYLSTSVKEIFTADPTLSRPISEPNRQINRKAGALLRIAVACRSPRVSTVDDYDYFFQKLRDCQTLETDSLHTTLSLNYPGEEPITTQKDGGISLFIDQSSENLKIFVPKRRADRVACFQSKLPRHLLRWIMSVDDTNIEDHVADEKTVTMVTAVLNAEVCGLKGIMDEHGIPEIDARFDDVDEEEYEEEENSVNTTESTFEDALNLAEGQMNETSPRQVDGGSPVPWSDTEGGQPILTPAHSTTSPPTLPRRESVFSTISTFLTATAGNSRANSAPAPVPVVPQRSPTPSQIPHSVVHHPVEDLSPYRNLLEQTVNKARTLSFPQHGAFNMSDMTRALVGDATTTDPVAGLPFLRVFGRRERDKMVGAAGELFVYEMLSHLDEPLPGFSINNWKSNIRGYVDVHPDYSAVSSWRGAETADFVYEDVSGALTSLLASSGCLDRYNVERLQQARPTYYLEVKSTPYPYITSFFMNGHQYRRMQSYSQSGPGQEDNLDNIYVILRVFNLGKDSVSLRALVDPHGMERRGELSFEAESWRVRPASG